MMNEQQQYYFSNAINLLALALGFENLQENRQQSAQNDVQAANDKQAEYMLAAINKRFDELLNVIRPSIKDGWNEAKGAALSRGRTLVVREYKSGEREVAIDNYLGNGWWQTEETGYTITHWMPLPDLPGSF